MFKKVIFKCVTLLIIISVSSVFCQGKKGIGLSINANQQYSEASETPLGAGFSAYYTMPIFSGVYMNLEAGYNQMGFVLGSEKTMNLVYLDVLASYDLLTTGQFRPYVQAGLGGFNFKYLVPGKESRYNDAEFVLGTGMRWYFNDHMAVNVAANLKYTTGDDLDGAQRGGNSINDMYYSFQGGLTYYFGKKKSTFEENDFFTDAFDSDGFSAEPFDDGESFSSSTPKESQSVNAGDSELADFLNEINTMDDPNGMGEGSTLAMQEYNRLKARISALKQTIEDKESEIYTIQKSREAVAEESQPLASREVHIVENNYDQSMLSTISLFSQSYENALKKFYSRRYQEAVDLFQALIQKYPDHALASNCEYWIGECFFNTGVYTRAIVSFNRVLEFEHSLKKDDALLMIGHCYLALGQKDKAHEALSRLIREYPESEHTQAAGQLLNK